MIPTSRRRSVSAESVLERIFRSSAAICWASVSAGRQAPSPWGDDPRPGPARGSHQSTQWGDPGERSRRQSATPKPWLSSGVCAVWLAAGASAADPRGRARSNLRSAVSSRDAAPERSSEPGPASRLHARVRRDVARTRLDLGSASRSARPRDQRIGRFLRGIPDLACRLDPGRGQLLHREDR